MNKKSLGIIGFGQLGNFISKHLSPHFEISVFDTKDKSKEAETMGVKFTNLEEAASKEIVIVSVPINAFENTIEKINPFLKKGTILIDVCSVKEKPSEIMQRLVSKEVDIIATHPLFGPQSGAKGIKGLKIVVFPIRTNRINKIINFLEDIELKVVIADPKKHDEDSAFTGLLAHFIGKALVNMSIENKEISEPSFLKLAELKNIVEKDSDELFRDIQKNNNFSKEMRRRFIEELQNIDKSLD